MSKIGKLITGIQLLIKNPYLINKVIDDSTILKNVVLNKNPHLKDGFPMLDLCDVLPDFNETITPFSFLNGGSLITDLVLLKGLTKQNNDCTYFEIGTWRGESVANVSNNAKTCFTLNLPNEDLKEMGCNQEYIAQQGFYSKTIKNVTHLKGNSFDFDFSPYYNKCDVIFVDGDHHYESVLNDTKIAYQLLKDENSVIIWHDYARNPGEIRWDILRGIFDGTPLEKRNNLFCVSNTLCALFTNSPTKIIDSTKITPNKKFNVTIKANKI